MNDAESVAELKAEVARLADIVAHGPLDFEVIEGTCRRLRQRAERSEAVGEEMAEALVGIRDDLVARWRETAPWARFITMHERGECDCHPARLDDSEA